MDRTRPDIRMTPEEIAAFVARQDRVVVAAVDGATPATSVGSAQLVDGMWRVTLPADDELVGLIKACDRICVLTDEFPTYNEIKGVVAHGSAHQQTTGPEDFSFSVVLDDVTSFDFSKLPAVKQR